MRDCLRDCVPIWYALFLRKDPIYKDGVTDADGNPIETGQYKEIYTDPVRVMVPVSPNTGAAEAEVFGSSVQYDRVISTVQRLGLTEQSRLWVDCTPENDTAPDYKVKRVAEGLDQNLYAIERIV